MICSSSPLPSSKHSEGHSLPRSRPERQAAMSSHEKNSTFESQGSWTYTKQQDFDSARLLAASLFFFPEIVRRSHVSLRPHHQVQLHYGVGARRRGIVPLVEVLDAEGRVRLRLLREGALAGGACLGLGGQHEALRRRVIKLRGKILETKLQKL